MNWAGGDPILNTFVNYPEGELARLIFHELGHQVVYTKNDTTFNESFATAVERLGGTRWLQTQADEKARQEYAAYDGRRRRFRELSRRTRERLKEVYDKPGMAPDAREAAKEKVMDQFRSEYAQMKADSGMDPKLWRGYDRWVREANNAFFGSQAAYDELVPGFEALFHARGDNWQAFYDAVRQLAKLPKEERHRQLKEAAGA
jgi:predicted aminopeptidase